MSFTGIPDLSSETQKKREKSAKAHQKPFFSVSRQERIRNWKIENSKFVLQLW